MILVQTPRVRSSPRRGTEDIAVVKTQTTRAIGGFDLPFFERQ